jgi:hypothetical protein
MIRHGVAAGWDATNQSIAWAAVATWHFIYKNRVELASWGALAACLTPGVGLALCAAAQVVAYTVRATARTQENGVRNSLGPNLGDAVFSIMSFSIAGALSRGAEAPGTASAAGIRAAAPFQAHPLGGFVVGLVASIGDIMNIANGDQV